MSSIETSEYVPVVIERQGELKTIPEYKVSKLTGQIRNSKTNAILNVKNDITNPNSSTIHLRLNGIDVSVSKRALIAYTFTGFPKNLQNPVAHHINLCQSDFTPINIIWMETGQSRILRNAAKPKIIKDSSQKQYTLLKKLVVKKDLSGNTIEVFDSLESAGLDVGMSEGTIRRHIYEAKPRNQFIYEYAERNEIVESLQEEEWKVLECNKDYCISTLGRIKHCISDNFEILIKCDKGPDSYPVWREPTSKINYLVHRLVFQHFHPDGNLLLEPDNKRVINHIDEQKTNNNINNLELVTIKENVNHSIGIPAYIFDEVDSDKIIAYYTSVKHARSHHPAFFNGSNLLYPN